MKLPVRPSLHIAAVFAAVLVGGCASDTPPETPVFTTQPASATVLAGAAVSFTVAATGNGTLSYQWRKDGSPLAGSVTASLDLAAVTSANAGVYDCIVTNAKGLISSVAVSSGAILAVNTAPVIVAQPVAQTTAPGGQVIFMVAASGSGTFSYQWKKDGVDLAGATQASYIIASAVAGSAGSYSCVVTNTLGATTTSTATAAAVLTVTAGAVTAPVISTQPAAVTVVAGADASFAVVASGNGTVTYQWRKDGVLVDGATSATLSLTAVTSANAGVYDCVATNTLGGLSSAAVSSGAMLAVNTAPVIVAQPAARSAASGSAVIFMVAASGNGTLSYQWKKDGVDISGATQASYTIASATAGSAGSYSCVVTNTVGETTTSTATAAAALTVTLGAATPPVISTQPAPVTVAAGGDASFTVAAAGNGTITLQWRKDGGLLAGATSATLALTAVNPANAGVYDCIVTNTLQGTSSSAVSTGAILSINGAPVVLAQPANQGAALTGAVTFTVVASGTGTLSYQWQKDTVDVAGATSASYTIASVAAGNVGSYRCVVTSTLGGTTASTTSNAATLTIVTSPLINAQSGSQTVAEGGTASFSVTAGGSSLGYQWYKGSTALANGGSVVGAKSATLTLTGLAVADSANYSCIVTSTVGTAVTTGTSNAAALVVVATPSISSQPAALTVAQGDPGSLSVTATSANGTLTYQWRQGGAGVAGATSATLSLASVAASDAGSYDCVVTNTIAGISNSVTTAAALLTVNTTVAITTQPSSVTQAEGATATLTVAATSTGTLSYQWQKAGVEIAGATADTLVFASLTAADAASYTCVVTSTLDTTVTSLTSAVAVVAVNTRPAITTAPLAQGAATGTTATFSVTATGAPGSTLSYQWHKAGVDIGGATSASYTTPAATVALDGVAYDCTITSALGTSPTIAVTTASVALSVAVLPTLTIASSAGATPNNYAGTGSEAAPTLTATITNANPALNGTVSYQWKKGGIAILGATASAYTLPGNVTLADAGSYTCSVSDTRNLAVATGTSAAIVIQVLAAPVITADLPASSYVKGIASPTNGSITLTAAAPAGGTLSYAWQQSLDGGANWGAATGTTNSSTYAAPAYPTGSARQYRCVITNTVGAGTVTTTSAASTVTLYQTAQIQASPSGQPLHTNVAAGSPASLTVIPVAPIAAIPGTTWTYQWYKGFTANVATAIPGATSATLSIAAASVGDASYYSCIITTSLAAGLQSGFFSTVTSNTVRLGVNTAPTIVTQPSAAPVATEATNTSALLSVVAAGAPNTVLTYQWRKGGVNLTGPNVATGATYTIPSPVAADAGSYDCVITSSLTAMANTAPAAAAPASALSVTTAAATLVVNRLPTVTTPTVSGTGPITLAETATNNNGAPSFLAYQWQRNGANLAGAILPTYTITELTSASAGNYTCVVSSKFVATPTSNASTATLTSPAAAVGVGTGVTSPAVTMAPTYTAGNPGIVITTPTLAGATYEWSLTNGSITAGAGTNTITVTAGASTALPMTATVVVSGATGGAVGTASATLVAAVTQAQILAPATVHPGDTWMVAGVNSQAGTYGWNVSGAGGVTGSAPTNTVTLPFSTNGGTVNGDVITLSATVQNAANDSAPTATRQVTVTTGTWIAKDGNVGWLLGAGPSNNTGAAAAVLANGRVLVSGGSTTGTVTPASAAIYDPATQRWTRVANMNVGRSGHTATALANGTVLVTGGTNNNSVLTYLNSGEIYDPVTDAWTLLATTNMIAGRQGHTATLLTTGANANKVVIIGGKAGNSNSDASNMIVVFQPSGSAGNNPGGTFSSSPATLNLARYSHTATVLGDGRVLIVGGTGLTNETWQQAEIFDGTASSSTGWTCTRAALTALPRLLHTATLLLDGRVLIAGGSQSVNTAELFDPASGAFTVTMDKAATPAQTFLKGGYLAANTSGRSQHAAIRLSDGRVLLTGGTGGSAQGVGQSTEVYDPSTGAFTNTAPMSNGRAFHLMVALPNDNTVMVLGGNSASSLNTVTSTTEIFNPSGAGSWTTVGSLDSRFQATATRLLDGRVLVAGGQRALQGSVGSPAVSQAVTATTQLYNPATGSWTAGPSLIAARWGHQAVLLADGRVLVTGGTGTGAANNNLASAELFDPAGNSGAGSWSAAGSMKTSRNSHQLVVLPGGKVLAVGGVENGGPYSQSSELWDGATTWAYTNDGTAQTLMTTARTKFSAVLVNGKVLVLGGQAGGGAPAPLTDAVDSFDPATQAWTALNPLQQPRSQHFGVALGNGKVILLGGNLPGSPGNPAVGVPGGSPGAIEIYDPGANGGQGGMVPTTNAFFKVGGRSAGSANIAQLPDGRIVLFGGAGSSWGDSSVEIYDPATDTLTLGTPMPALQGNGPLAVVLGNGDVMAIGGDKTDSTTQIYRPLPPAP